ncbi:hypothetical protein ACFQ3P_25695 [Paraburkholderia sabiae]|uniref:Uncharacterized protein n=1 Tax=Paraburkholderia sabiae TaxID=273251 RepID=A0ABU9QLT1_9BURK|nr:hypothetical protein [Paraburkholderia sabiae]WJZ77307.1 hypothetical protein QEN71_35130 [Paraburkholderia sabiae]CAD6547986.1 hypothetical protein LMG24235_04513 [Paraburkholderia sabiae]
MPDWTRYNAELLAKVGIPWPRLHPATHRPPPDDVRGEWHVPDTAGAGSASSPASPWQAVYEPADPSPWRVAYDALRQVSLQIVSLVALREALSRKGAQAAVAAQQAGIDARIDDEIDNWCGTRVPLHWPHPRTLALASELALLASQIPDTEVQTALVGISTRILERSA